MSGEVGMPTDATCGCADSEWVLAGVETVEREMFVDEAGDHYLCLGCDGEPWPSGERPAVQVTFRHGDWTWLFNVCERDRPRMGLQPGMTLAELRSHIQAGRERTS